jgi:hypothetical protein
MIEADRAIQQVIDFLANLNDINVDQLSLPHCNFDPDKLLSDDSASPD